MKPNVDSLTSREPIQHHGVAYFSHKILMKCGFSAESITQLFGPPDLVNHLETVVEQDRQISRPTALYLRSRVLGVLKVPGFPAVEVVKPATRKLRVRVDTNVTRPADTRKLPQEEQRKRTEPLAPPAKSAAERPSASEGEYFSYSELRFTRGWTRRQISELLGRADVMEARIRDELPYVLTLFLAGRVRPVEIKHRIRAESQLTPAEQAERHAQKRRNEQLVRTVPFQFPLRGELTLARDAKEWFERSFGLEKTPPMTRETAPLLSVYYLHAMALRSVPEEQELDPSTGLFSGAYALLTRRIYLQISRDYPHLSNTCEQCWSRVVAAGLHSDDKRWNIASDESDRAMFQVKPDVQRRSVV